MAAAKGVVDTREVADGIIRATARWPSAAAIRGLVDEYLQQGSQERRVVILLDVLDCLRQDMAAASEECAELRVLMTRMSDARSMFEGAPNGRGCTHVKRGMKNDGAEREALAPGRRAPWRTGFQ